MRLRFILAVLILLLACAFQFWFASVNVFVNFILSALIVFAFFFDVWELLVFILFAVLVINWAPAASVDIFVFGLIPLAALAFHKAFRWSPWAAIPVSIVAGFFLLYIAIAPGAFFADWELFLVDLFGGLVFGGFIFLTMDRLALS